MTAQTIVGWTVAGGIILLIGMSPADAVFASSIRDLGRFGRSLYRGRADRPRRPGAQRRRGATMPPASCSSPRSSLVALPYALLLVVTFFAGMTIIGSQTGANATCGKLYPARMRTTGLGWALGIGRLGGIAAPALGGWLLALGLAPTHIFLSACGSP